MTDVAVFHSDSSGWAKTVVPLTCVKNGRGPTVLALGGNHGDEYEGQIALSKLARDLVPQCVSGRIILIPCLSMEASQAGTRLWPDGSNFNRSFPGSPEGGPASQLADYLTRVLIPMADIVIDIHSGGRSMTCQPMSHMHWIDDAKQRRAMVEGMLAWNTEVHMLYADVAGSGLLPSEAERQGKIVVTTELGGGGYVSPKTHQIAYDGLVNVLRHFGALEGESVTRRSLGLPDPVIYDALDADGYLMAPESGLFESKVDPGDDVEAGDVLGRIHFLERPDRDALEIASPIDGSVCAVRALSQTRQGACVVVVGRKMPLKDLL